MTLWMQYRKDIEEGEFVASGTYIEWLEAKAQVISRERDEAQHERDKATEKVSLTEHWKDVALRERDEARAMVAELLTMADDLLGDCFAEHGPTQGVECATCDRYERYRVRLAEVKAALHG